MWGSDGCLRIFDRSLGQCRSSVKERAALWAAPALANNHSLEAACEDRAHRRTPKPATQTIQAALAKWAPAEEAKWREQPLEQQ